MTPTNPIVYSETELKVQETYLKWSEAIDARKLAQEKERDAQNEYEKAKVEHAYSTCPKGFTPGAKVCRYMKQVHGTIWSRTYKTKEIRQTGIVALCGGSVRPNCFRGYTPKIGEWFVQSYSGVTAYKLDDIRNPWSLQQENPYAA